MEDPSDAIPPTTLVTVLIENPKKSGNWGPLLRCCAAFGISRIFVVGFDKCSVQGSHGASKHVELVAFHDYPAATTALREMGFELIGLLQGAPDAYDEGGYPVRNLEGTTPTVVAVDPSGTEASEGLPRSFPVQARRFSPRTCLAVGKGPRGLPESLARLCASFVHIPHRGLADSASTHTNCWLTPEAGLSIALHEFCAWAGFDKDRAGLYRGQKYDVQRPIRGRSDDQQRKRDERRRARDDNDDDEPATLHESVFGSSADDGDY